MVHETIEAQGERFGVIPRVPTSSASESSRFGRDQPPRMASSASGNQVSISCTVSDARRLVGLMRRRSTTSVSSSIGITRRMPNCRHMGLRHVRQDGSGVGQRDTKRTDHCFGGTAKGLEDLRAPLVHPFPDLGSLRRPAGEHEVLGEPRPPLRVGQRIPAGPAAGGAGTIDTGDPMPGRSGEPLSPDRRRAQVMSSIGASVRALPFRTTTSSLPHAPSGIVPPRGRRVPLGVGGPAGLERMRSRGRRNRRTSRRRAQSARGAVRGRASLVPSAGESALAGHGRAGGQCRLSDRGGLEVGGREPRPQGCSRWGSVRA